MKPYRFLLFAAFILLASCAKEPLDQAAIPGADGGYVDQDNVIKGWVRIKLADDAQLLKVGAFTRGAADSGDSDLDMLAADLGATEIREVFPTDPRFVERHHKYGLHLWFDVKFDDNVTVTRAKGMFESLPNVAYVEPIYRIEMTDGPDYIMPAKDGYTVGAMANTAASTATKMPFNDPELWKQWHYNNDGSIDKSIAGADIGLFEAWEKYGAGDPNVIVAIMDNAVNYEHPDLAANMWVNLGEIPGNGIDDDGNKYIDDIYGWNFNDPAAGLVVSSHGTHVAGTVAAVNHNDIGVCGVAGGTGVGDGVRLMSTQIYDFDGVGETPPAAYVYAADNGAVISQNSWNIPSMSGRPIMPQALSVAFDYFIENAGTDRKGNQLPGSLMKGGIIIFAAGNGYTGAAGVPGDDPRVVCVSAMKPNYKKAPYSNYGVDVDIFAPGGSGSTDTEFGEEGYVYSTDITPTGYGYKSGTSMACPHVSGVAALIVSKFGGSGFTPEELRERLLRSVRDVGAYQESTAIANGLGSGLLDARLIDLKDSGTLPNKPEEITITAKEELRLTVNITVPADGNGNAVSGFNMTYVKKSDKDNQSAWRKMTIHNGQAIGSIKSEVVSGLEDATDYIFRVSAYDRFGHISDITEVEGRTIDHINRAPQHKASMNPINLPIVSGNETLFETTLDLNEYFTDPDLPNDKLTFSVESRDESLVTASIKDEHILFVKAVGKGTTSLAVYAQDIAGLKINKGVSIRINQDLPGGVLITKTFSPIDFPVIQNGEKIFKASYQLQDYFSSNSVLTFSVTNDNRSAVSASIENGSTLMVTGLALGRANVTVVATNVLGKQASQPISVNVSENPGGEVVVGQSELSIYPNPVVDFVKLSINGAGTTSGKIKIYDLASRIVKQGEVNLVGDVMQSYDMKTLSPGVYTMVVNVAGTDYKKTFVKK